MIKIFVKFLKHMYSCPLFHFKFKWHLLYLIHYIDNHKLEGINQVLSVIWPKSLGLRTEDEFFLHLYENMHFRSAMEQTETETRQRCCFLTWTLMWRCMTTWLLRKSKKIFKTVSAISIGSWVTVINTLWYT